MEISRIFVQFPAWARASFLKRVLNISGVHQASFTGRNLSFEVTLPKREADQSPPPRTKIKDEWRYTSASLLAFLPCTRIILSFISPTNNSYEENKIPIKSTLITWQFCCITAKHNLWHTLARRPVLQHNSHSWSNFTSALRNVSCRDQPVPILF